MYTCVSLLNRDGVACIFRRFVENNYVYMMFISLLLSIRDYRNRENSIDFNDRCRVTRYKEVYVQK